MIPSDRRPSDLINNMPPPKRARTDPYEDLSNKVNDYWKSEAQTLSNFGDQNISEKKILQGINCYERAETIYRNHNIECPARTKNQTKLTTIYENLSASNTIAEK